MSQDVLDRLVDAHAAVYDGLLGATDALRDREWSTPTGCPGWDVHDQLAHCIGVERAMLGDPPPSVVLPELPHVRSGFSEYTELDVHVRRGVPGGKLRAEARETFERRLTGLRALDPSVLGEEMDSPLGRRRGSQVLRLRLYDLATHEQDIRRALGRESALDGPHHDIAIEQTLRLWGAVLPRAVHAGVVAIDVVGRERVVLDLAAGALHREGGPDVDATLRLTPAQVLSVGGGRDDAPGLDELEVTGDRELAGRVLAAAGVTP